MFGKQLRQLKRTAAYLKGYFDFERASNQIVRRTPSPSDRQPVV